MRKHTAAEMDKSGTSNQKNGTNDRPKGTDSTVYQCYQHTYTQSDTQTTLRVTSVHAMRPNNDKRWKRQVVFNSGHLGPSGHLRRKVPKYLMGAKLPTGAKDLRALPKASIVPPLIHSG